jgi:predicted methyltransferase MtxX (methanogen marker protein 4)
MYSRVSQKLCKFARLCMYGLLFIFCSLSIADPLEISPEKKEIDFVLSKEIDGITKVKASQLSLKQVLDTLASKVNIPIHYSTLPAGLVNATCKASDLKQLLECLLDNKADLIVRYGKKQAKSDMRKPVVEAWILASKANSAFPKAEMPIITDNNSGANKASQQDSEVVNDRVEVLLTKAHSLNPKERAAAVGALLTGRKGDPEIRATLEQALYDQDSEVRAQAISSLSHREKNQAIGAIQQALKDSSDDVRLMAVEGITDNVALLQQALNDSDESVRSLAEIKLELLTQEQGNRPE